MPPRSGGLDQTDQQRHVAWSLRMKNARAQRVALSSPRSGAFSKILASRRRRLAAFFMTREGVGVCPVKNQSWPTRRDTSIALVGLHSARREGGWITPGLQEADPGVARVGVPAWAVEEPSALRDRETAGVTDLLAPWRGPPSSLSQRRLMYSPTRQVVAGLHPHRRTPAAYTY